MHYRNLMVAFLAVPALAACSVEIEQRPSAQGSSNVLPASARASVPAAKPASNLSGVNFNHFTPQDIAAYVDGKVIGAYEGLEMTDSGKIVLPYGLFLKEDKSATWIRPWGAGARVDQISADRITRNPDGTLTIVMPSNGRPLTLNPKDGSWTIRGSRSSNHRVVMELPSA